jgi:transposase
VKRIILKTGKTDLRYGIEKLASLIRLEYGLEPLEEGTLFLFCGNKKDRIKALIYEGDGYVLLTKKKTRGSFQWPSNAYEAREMSRENYTKLMEGYTVESYLKSYKKLG